MVVVDMIQPIDLVKKSTSGQRDGTRDFGALVLGFSTFADLLNRDDARRGGGDVVALEFLSTPPNPGDIDFGHTHCESIHLRRRRW